MVSVRRPLPVPAEADEARFALTSCFAAGQCQGDLGCPVRSGCCREYWLKGDDDGFDDG